MAHHRSQPAARRRLVVPPPPAGSAAPLEPLPVLLRTPWIAVLWGLALLTAVGALTLGRMRLPRRVHGVAVAVRPAADSVALLLLLPAAAGRHIRAGQHATLERGDGGPVTLTISSVEHHPLDVRAARRRFPHSPSILAHLDAPKLVARLHPCTTGGCLTPQPGTSFAAVATLGTRTLASYAVPRS